ncbi:hypothetical protein ACH3VR_02635 [Microbacterium sp. B2969]|uniref:DUF7882 domain-containing protein n=1 Tax=Microbacterium alkaliflavum TaxID=3248839 RepID=A0ABW7Q339_9MICO
MGNLYYGVVATPVWMPDRLLAHLKVVISAKLRRNESFTITWPHPAAEMWGSTTIRVQPAIPMRFVFDEPEGEPLDATWLQKLADASTRRGIVLHASDMTESESEPTPDAV